MCKLSNINIQHKYMNVRGGSRAAATSKIERFVIIVNGFQPLTIITKCSILDVATVLDLPLNVFIKSLFYLHLIVTMLKFSSPVIVTLAFIILKPNNFLFSIFSLKIS